MFDKNYDRSLWLMVAGDDINIDKIALVIKNIPFELAEQIRELIEETKKGVSSNRVINFEMDNLSYEVTIREEELYIKMIKSNDNMKEMIELFILPIRESSLESMKWYVSEYLGGFSHTYYYNSFTCGTTLDEYNFVKTPIGSYVTLYTDNKVKCVDVRRVNVDRMPNNIYIHQFRTEESIKRLVRGKK